MAPKKALKTTEKKPLEKPISKSKKLKKKNYRSFSIYLYKTLQSVTKENFAISRKSMMIMNDFVNDMLEKIAGEAARLVSVSKKKTLSAGAIQSAIRLLIPGELGKHANMEGAKALNMYTNSRSRRRINPQIK